MRVVAYGARTKVTETIKRVETVRFDAKMLRNVLGLNDDCKLHVEITRYGPADDDGPEQVTYELTGDLIAITTKVTEETR